MLIARRNGMAVKVVESYKVKPITFTSNVSNCKAFADAVTSLIQVTLGTNVSGICVATVKRQNMPLEIAFVHGQCALSGASTILRWRNNAAGFANIEAGYDADVRVGDVFNLYYRDEQDWSTLPS